MELILIPLAIMAAFWGIYALFMAIWGIIKEAGSLLEYIYMYVIVWPCIKFMKFAPPCPCNGWVFQRDSFN